MRQTQVRFLVTITSKLSSPKEGSASITRNPEDLQLLCRLPGFHNHILRQINAGYPVSLPARRKAKTGTGPHIQDPRFPAFHIRKVPPQFPQPLLMLRRNIPAAAGRRTPPARCDQYDTICFSIPPSDSSSGFPRNKKEMRPFITPLSKH